MFLGPTGVGKTEMARSLAEFLFGSDDAMIRLDMSEFMERHEAAKLIGAPPGYVGYEKAENLQRRSDAVRTPLSFSTRSKRPTRCIQHASPAP